METNLYTLLHEHILLKEPGKLVRPARVPGIQIGPEVAGTFLHEVWQHVLLSPVAELTGLVE